LFRERDSTVAMERSRVVGVDSAWAGVVSGSEVMRVGLIKARTRKALPEFFIDFNVSDISGFLRLGMLLT
jgi:hypothetical protein